MSARVRPWMASAAMAVFGNSCNARAILVIRIPACAGLQGHGRRDCLYNASQNARDQFLVLQQRGTRQSIADFLGGTTHIDVDDLGAEHFRGGEARAETAAENSKRSVGHAGHGREQDVGRQRIGTYLDAHRVGTAGALSFAHENFLSAPRRHTSISNPSALFPGSRMS